MAKESVKVQGSEGEQIEPKETETSVSKENKTAATNSKGEDVDATPPAWILWSAASYAIVMLVIGLPLWWKTTAVQRAFLPYDEMLTSMDTLNKNLKIAIPINFHGFSNETKTDFLYTFDEGERHKGYTFMYSFVKTSPSDIDSIYKTADLYEIDSKMCVKDKLTEGFNIFYVGRADFLKKYGHRVILGNCRSAYYISNSSKMVPALILKLLQNFVPSFTNALVSTTNPQAEQIAELQLPLSLGYDILLSLVVSDPEIQDYTWNIQEARKKYFDAILNKLSNFSDMNLRSQYLYYMKLNFDPKYNKERNSYEVPYEQLPLVINPVESKLTSFVSQNSALNFLIYTAPCEQYPLHILDSDGVPIPSNSFMVPQWGGIQVYNSPCNIQVASENDTSRSIQDVSLDKIVSVVVSQLRELVGITSEDKSVEVLQLRQSVLRDWEVDVITRKRLHNLLYTTANTLQSLGQLLDKITNIMVTEEVGLEVESSVEALFHAVEAASKGKLAKAQKYATSAYKASEIAFHHPTNLAQLYFPDDQKYAIYIPLFLPIGIPVLVSLSSIISSCTRIYKERRT